MRREHLLLSRKKYFIFTMEHVFLLIGRKSFAMNVVRTAGGNTENKFKFDHGKITLSIKRNISLFERIFLQTIVVIRLISREIFLLAILLFVRSFLFFFLLLIDYKYIPKSVLFLIIKNSPIFVSIHQHQ